MTREASARLVYRAAHFAGEFDTVGLDARVIRLDRLQRIVDFLRKREQARASQTELQACDNRADRQY